MRHDHLRSYQQVQIQRAWAPRDFPVSIPARFPFPLLAKFQEFQGRTLEFQEQRRVEEHWLFWANGFCKVNLRTGFNGEKLGNLCRNPGKGPQNLPQITP